jgi:hypothetical protein
MKGLVVGSLVAVAVIACGPVANRNDAGGPMGDRHDAAGGDAAGGGSGRDGGGVGGGTSDARLIADGSTTEPTPITCHPGENLCLNNHLWSCNLSGSDATHFQDCATGGSVTNPGVCSTVGCPAGQTACCTRAQQSCVFSMTSPHNGTGEVPPSSCFGVSTSATPACGSFIVQFANYNPLIPNMCTSAAPDQLTVVLDRTKRTPGIFVPTAGEINFSSGGVSCATWTGNVHWISDSPAWAVDIDLTCTGTDPANGLRLVVSTHGQN